MNDDDEERREEREIEETREGWGLGVGGLCTCGIWNTFHCICMHVQTVQWAPNVYNFHNL